MKSKKFVPLAEMAKHLPRVSSPLCSHAVEISRSSLYSCAMYSYFLYVLSIQYITLCNIADA